MRHNAHPNFGWEVINLRVNGFERLLDIERGKDIKQTRKSCNGTNARSGRRSRIVGG